jgi:hypothetical protein
MGLSQDDVGPTIIINYQNDTAHFKIITENNGNRNARNIKAKLIFVPASGRLYKLRSYPLVFKEDFVASKRFYTMLPSTSGMPVVDTMFIYLKIDFSSDLGKKEFHIEKIYLWIKKELIGQIDPAPRISSFLKDCYKICDIINPNLIFSSHLEYILCGLEGIKMQHPSPSTLDDRLS